MWLLTLNMSAHCYFLTNVFIVLNNSNMLAQGINYALCLACSRWLIRCLK